MNTSPKAPTPPPSVASASPAKQWTGSMAEKPAAATESKESPFDQLMKDPEYRKVQAEREAEFALEQAKKKGQKFNTSEAKSFKEKVIALSKKSYGWGISE